MLQYLVILLDDTSVSYCHCDNPHSKRRLISLDHLKSGITYAMKHNMMIQFVFPGYQIPNDYLNAIDTIDHHEIKPWSPSVKNANVIVLDGIPDTYTPPSHQVTVLRTTKTDLFANGDHIAALLPKTQRMNIVIIDIETFTDEDLNRYNTLLDQWAGILTNEYISGRTPQLNLLTDRIILTNPNNCNAGITNITLAPNGKFYLCPAFYYSNPNNEIDPQDIPNHQLLRLDHAPLCRHCDAFHCRRCIWLNQKTTYELNTPSHEQCIVAHTERNASRRMLQSIRKKTIFMPDVEISEIKYLDPFDVRKKW
ncbi:MAG: CXXX repeat peptide maturase [Bacteroidales bacterium]|nr:CXXX repeat peptide maturase [Bacteroidales bacterium]